MSDLSDIPEGALEAVAEALQRESNGVAYGGDPNYWRGLARAALSRLASTSEGRGYLLRLVFGEQELNVLRAAVELTYPHPGSAVASTHTKLRCAVEPPTEEPLP